MEGYRILKWDSEFFGFPVAHISSPGLIAGQLEGILSELRKNSVKLAYWPTANALNCVDRDSITELGGRLVDEKTTFLMDLDSMRTQPAKDFPTDIVVEKYDSSMSKADLHALAIQCGEYSRFAVDPYIPRAKFEEMYTLWIDKSLAGEFADEVLVVRDNSDRVVAMATLAQKNERGDIGLIAVDVKLRGRKIGEMLVRHAQEWFAGKGYRYAQVVTQGANTPACHLYSKCGFSVEKKELYHHFWL